MKAGVCFKHVGYTTMFNMNNNIAYRLLQLASTKQCLIAILFEIFLSLDLIYEELYVLCIRTYTNNGEYVSISRETESGFVKFSIHSTSQS